MPWLAWIFLFNLNLFFRVPSIRASFLEKMFARIWIWNTANDGPFFCIMLTKRTNWSRCWCSALWWWTIFYFGFHFLKPSLGHHFWLKTWNIDCIFIILDQLFEIHLKSNVDYVRIMKRFSRMLLLSNEDSDVQVSLKVGKCAFDRHFLSRQLSKHLLSVPPKTFTKKRLQNLFKRKSKTKKREKIDKIH